MCIQGAEVAGSLFQSNVRVGPIAFADVSARILQLQLFTT